MQKFQLNEKTLSKCNFKPGDLEGVYFVQKKDDLMT